MLTQLAVTVSPAITEAMLEPVIGMFSANIAVVMPIAVGLYSIVKGVSLVPRIIGMFVH